MKNLLAIKTKCVKKDRCFMENYFKDSKEYIDNVRNNSIINT